MAEVGLQVFMDSVDRVTVGSRRVLNKQSTVFRRAVPARLWLTTDD
jgi:hypothetical protein